MDYESKQERIFDNVMTCVFGICFGLVIGLAIVL